MLTNNFLKISCVVSIITTYLTNKEVAQCFSLSKDTLLLLMDHASPIFFKYTRKKNASILGFDFLLHIAKHRFSPSKNMNNHLCIKCLSCYKKKKSQFCVLCF